MGKTFNTGVLILTIILSISSVALADINLEARSYLLGDYETGEILEGHNIDKAIEIASISKLMTYTLVMEYIENGAISFADKICVDQDVTRITGGSLDLVEGEIFTVLELLKASLVVSANDATYALSKHVAGTEEDFAKLMNNKAKEIGLNSANFVNSTGLPKGEFQNKMSTEDIFKLCSFILDKYPEILSLTTIPYIEVEYRGYKKENTNPLLNKIEGVDGLKTGSTIKAGYCLAASVNIGGDGIRTDDLRLISIVMGTKSMEERGDLSRELIQYGIENYSKRILINKDFPVGYVYIAKSKEKEIEVYPLESFSKLCKKGDYIDRDVLIDQDIKLPLKPMDKIGKVVLTENGYVLKETDIIVLREVRKENLFIRILKWIKGFISRIFSPIFSKWL